MYGFVIGLMLLVVPGCSGTVTLDKTGTSGFKSACPVSQTLKKQEPARAGSFGAEREGFEATLGTLVLRRLRLAIASRELENPGFHGTPCLLYIVVALSLGGHDCPQIAPKYFAPARALRGRSRNFLPLPTLHLTRRGT